jgi:hypothetical protein
MPRPRCGNDPRAQLTDADRQAIADFRAYLTRRAQEKTMTDHNSTDWYGAVELVPDREVERLAATGLVGYQQDRGRLLHCLKHKPVPASRYVDFQGVGADDLPDGGICVHPRCGADLLAVLPARADEAQP